MKVNGAALAEQRALVDDLLDRIEGALDRLVRKRTTTNNSTNLNNVDSNGRAARIDEDDPVTTADDIGPLINDLRSHSLRIGVNTMQLERLIHLVVRASSNANKSLFRAVFALFFFFFFFSLTV
jgi:hypothetical protein